MVAKKAAETVETTADKMAAVKVEKKVAYSVERRAAS